MKINHIALYTKDLERMKKFYEKYFHAVSNEKYHNKNTGLMTYFLSFDDDSRLEIMTRPDVFETERNNLDCGYIHVAFSVGTAENVDSLTEKLEQDGYKVISRPRTTGDGYYESSVCDPDGNIIEITI